RHPSSTLFPYTTLFRSRRTGLVDIQSHTYWHPNFKVEKRRLAAAAYDEFVTMQLVKPRRVLQAKLGIDTDVLAWPFGIYDDDLRSEEHTSELQSLAYLV